jgi:hypothetical protein
MQLSASAVTIDDPDLLRQQKIDKFVSTDSIQCEIAHLEGLATINPLAAVP